VADTFSALERSRIMALIRSGDTKPELLVRRLLFSLGYRYRLRPANLPGKPDIVLPSQKAAIFVHGCFWHLHGRCRGGRLPGSRIEYWGPKLIGNRERDRANRRRLARGGWRVLVIWECQAQDPKRLLAKVRTFLSERQHSA